MRCSDGQFWQLLFDGWYRRVQSLWLLGKFLSVSLLQFLLEPVFAPLGRSAIASCETLVNKLCPLPLWRVSFLFNPILRFHRSWKDRTVAFDQIGKEQSGKTVVQRLAGLYWWPKHAGTQYMAKFDGVIVIRFLALRRGYEISQVLKHLVQHDQVNLGNPSQQLKKLANPSLLINRIGTDCAQMSEGTIIPSKLMTQTGGIDRLDIGIEAWRYQWHSELK